MKRPTSNSANMKRPGTITDFFTPFAQPKHTRALSEERRDRGSSFPSLGAPLRIPAFVPHTSTDVAGNPEPSKRPRWPAVERQSNARHAPPSNLRRDISSPSPPPPQHRLARESPPHDPQTNGSAQALHPESSFTSSLSSIPPQSSHSSVASKRMMKDGMPLVKTSDSEEDDSGSELEDLSVILSKKRRVEAPPAKPTPTMKLRSAPDRSASDLRSHFKRAPRRNFQSIIPPRQKYKVSLSDLVAERKKGLDSEARVLEAQRKAEAAEKEAEASKESGRLTRERLNASLGDAESVQKTYDALQRTEALEMNLVWQFFEQTGHETTAPSFPAQSVPALEWQRKLKGEFVVHVNHIANCLHKLDSSTRYAAFVSGLVKSRVSTQSLPDEVILWMMDDLCHSRRGDLTDAYLGVFDFSTPQLRKLLDRQAISGLFRNIGSRKDAIAIDEQQPKIRPVEVYSHELKRPPPHGSARLLEFLRRAAPHLESNAVEYALEVLIRLSFDDSVRQDGDFQIQCQETIAAMFKALSDEDEPGVSRRVSQTLFNNFRNQGPKEDRFVNHILQAQLVQSLPATTRREATFLRRLSLAFFLDSPKPLTLALTASGILPAILQSLTNSALYRFSPRTDYADVTAAFGLLDAAVDSGFSDHSFTHTLHSLERRSGDPRVRELRDAARAAEDEFNLGIDALTATVRRIMGQIRGSGTESVRMSEAKGAMERLVYRLESSVRTREKSSADIFANRALGGASGSAGLMANWIGGDGGGGGSGGVEEVGGDAPKEEEGGKVDGEGEDERRDEVAD